VEQIFPGVSQPVQFYWGGKPASHLTKEDSILHLQKMSTPQRKEAMLNIHIFMEIMHTNVIFD
jgi:hypothetical protein